MDIYCFHPLLLGTFPALPPPVPSFWGDIKMTVSHLKITGPGSRPRGSRIGRSDQSATGWAER